MRSLKGGHMKKLVLGLVMAVLILLPRMVLAEDQGLHLGGMDKEAKKAKIEAKKTAHQSQKDVEKARRKAERDAEKAKRKSEKAAEKAKRKAERASNKQ